MDNEVSRIWDQIEWWDAAYLDPELGSDLMAPASETAIEALNRRFGGILPNEFLFSLRRHDGTQLWSTAFHNGHLLGTAAVIESLNSRVEIAREMQEANQYNQISLEGDLDPTGPVKGVFWSPAWVPIQENDWSVCCLDFDPAPGGVFGQVVEVYWEACTVKVIANNYVDFLHLCANELPEEPQE